MSVTIFSWRSWTGETSRGLICFNKFIDFYSTTAHDTDAAAFTRIKQGNQLDRTWLVIANPFPFQEMRVRFATQDHKSIRYYFDQLEWETTWNHLWMLYHLMQRKRAEGKTEFRWLCATNIDMMEDMKQWNWQDMTRKSLENIYHHYFMWVFHIAFLLVIMMMMLWEHPKKTQLELVKRTTNRTKSLQFIINDENNWIWAERGAERGKVSVRRDRRTFPFFHFSRLTTNNEKDEKRFENELLIRFFAFVHSSEIEEQANTQRQSSQRIWEKWQSSIIY